MKFKNQTVLFIILATLLSCAGNKDLLNVTLYHKNGKKLSGYTPKNTRTGFRRNKKGIWFNEINRNYLKSYVIDKDSFAIVPYLKHRSFAKVIENGSPLDLFMSSYQTDSCIQTNSVSLFDVMGTLIDIMGLFHGKIPENDVQSGNDYNCQKRVKYEVQSFFLVNNKHKQSIILNDDRSDSFIKDQLLNFFTPYPDFQKEIYEDSYAKTDIPFLVRRFNAIHSKELNPGVKNDYPGKIIFYVKKERKLTGDLFVKKGDMMVKLDFENRSVIEIYTDDVLTTSICYNDQDCFKPLFMPKTISYIEINPKANGERPTVKKVDKEEGTNQVAYLTKVEESRSRQEKK